MLYAFFFLLILTLISIYFNPTVCVSIILFLIPQQYLLKIFFENEFKSGDLFSVWKELLVIILFFKLQSYKKITHNRILLIIISFFCLALAYYLFTNNYINSLASLRNYTFPILIFICIGFKKINLNYNFISKAIVVTIIISIFFGFIEHFYMKLPFALYKQIVDNIDVDGNVSYSSTSHKIMNVERMSGAFSGPNEFGVFIAISFLFIIILLSNISIKRTQKYKLFFASIIILVCIGWCLLVSYSRAGWLIATLGSIVYFIVIKRARLSILFISIISIMLVSILLPFISSDINNIIINSFTLKESSASDRSNQFFRGFNTVLFEPFGHGVGTSDLRFKDSLGFFVESAWWNIGYELGIIGLSLYLYLHTLLFLRLYKCVNRGLKYKIPLTHYRFDILSTCLILPTLITGFISINVMSTTFIYYYWIILGLAFNIIHRIDNTGNTFLGLKRRSQIYI